MAYLLALNLKVLLPIVIIFLASEMFGQPASKCSGTSFHVKVDPDNYLEAVFRVAAFQPIKGELCLSDDSIKFSVAKDKFSDRNFQFDWSEVQTVYKSGRFFFRNRFFFPSLITIVADDGENRNEVWLSTTKRREIVRAIKKRIE